MSHCNCKLLECPCVESALDLLRVLFEKSFNNEPVGYYHQFRKFSPHFAMFSTMGEAGRDIEKLTYERESWKTQAQYNAQRVDELKQKKESWKEVAHRNAEEVNKLKQEKQTQALTIYQTANSYMSTDGDCWPGNISIELKPMFETLRRAYKAGFRLNGNDMIDNHNYPSISEATRNANAERYYEALKEKEEQDNRISEMYKKCLVLEMRLADRDSEVEYLKKDDKERDEKLKILELKINPEAEQIKALECHLNARNERIKELEEIHAVQSEKIKELETIAEYRLNMLNYLKDVCDKQANEIQELNKELGANYKYNKNKAAVHSQLSWLYQRLNTYASGYDVIRYKEDFLPLKDACKEIHDKLFGE